MYLVCKTPYRVSFFGGGTDFPEWYKDHGGAVLGTTIDKYCYTQCTQAPQLTQIPTLENKFNPKIKQILNYLKISENLEISFNHDLPSMSGIGSSSALVVGVVYAISQYMNLSLSKMNIGRKSITIEQEILKEYVGCQDQILSSHGGLNTVEFKVDGKIRVKPLELSSERKNFFNQHLMLYFTGKTRISSFYAKEIIDQLSHHQRELHEMKTLVHEAENILLSSGDLADFGRLMHHNWQIKKQLSKSISSSDLDEVYLQAIRYGALGGKILGAGGGGFLLLFVPPEKQNQFKKKLEKNLTNFTHFPFGLDENGPQVVVKERSLENVERHLGHRPMWGNGKKVEDDCMGPSETYGHHQ